MHLILLQIIHTAKSVLSQKDGDARDQQEMDVNIAADTIDGINSSNIPEDETKAVNSAGGESGLQEED